MMERYRILRKSRRYYSAALSYFASRSDHWRTLPIRRISGLIFRGASGLNFLHLFHSSAPAAVALNMNPKSGRPLRQMTFSRFSTDSAGNMYSASLLKENSHLYSAIMSGQTRVD